MWSSMRRVTGSWEDATQSRFFSSPLCAKISETPSLPGFSVEGGEGNAHEEDVNGAWRCTDSPGYSAWWRHKAGTPRGWPRPFAGKSRAPPTKRSRPPSSAAWRCTEPPGCSASWRHQASTFRGWPRTATVGSKVPPRGRSRPPSSAARHCTDLPSCSASWRDRGSTPRGWPRPAAVESQEPPGRQPQRASSSAGNRSVSNSSNVTGDRPEAAYGCNRQAPAHIRGLLRPRLSIQTLHRAPKELVQSQLGPVLIGGQRG